MKKYEAVFILDIRKVEDDGEAFSKEFAGMIEKWGGEMFETKSMGRNQFAQEIKKRKAGVYWNFVFSAEADKVLAIKNQFRLDERVLRNMIIIFDRPDVLTQIAESQEPERDHDYDRDRDRGRGRERE